MSKSNVNTRLYTLFSSTQNAPNSFIRHNLPKIRSPKPAENPASLLVNYQRVKDLLSEGDSQKLVQKFKSLSHEKWFRLKHRVYENTIYRLSLAKQNSLIEDALEYQKKFISREAFAALIIILYGKAGMFDHALKVFDELPQLGCPRETKSFHALLVAASSSGRFDKVYELFRELPSRLSIKPSILCYNTTAHALCRLGLFDDAVELVFDEMEENGLKPNVVSFNTLLGAFYEKKAFEEGEKIWARMIAMGLVPDTLSYNFKLQRLVNDGKVSATMELVAGLEGKGLTPDVGTYNVLILGACKNGDLDGARLWYTELLNSGCYPNKVTFNTIVPFLCDKGDYGLAYQVCKRMFRHQCAVDESLMQKVVNELANNSMIEEARILVGLGRSNSYFPYNLKLRSGIMRYFF